MGSPSQESSLLLVNSERTRTSYNEMAVRVGTIHPCIMLVLWNLGHFSFLSVTYLPPPPHHQIWCHYIRISVQLSRISEPKVKQAPRTLRNQASSTQRQVCPYKQLSSQAGGTRSKSFPLSQKMKIKKKKKLLTRGEEHVLDETYNLLWRNLKNILLKTNPIKVEAQVYNRPCGKSGTQIKQLARSWIHFLLSELLS